MARYMIKTSAWPRLVKPGTFRSNMLLMVLSQNFRSLNFVTV
jgi:hypothetical protein